MLPVLRLYQVAVRSRNSRGFLLLEMLVFTALLSIAALFFAMQSKAYTAWYEKMQLQTAAEVLASDIRVLQQQSLFDDGILNRQIKFMPANNGYAFYTDRKVVKKIYFSDLGCKNVYIDRKMAAVQFTNNGSPSYTGSVILKHRKNPAAVCTVSVQPVTGRVVISAQ